MSTSPRRSVLRRLHPLQTSTPAVRGRDREALPVVRRPAALWLLALIALVVPAQASAKNPITRFAAGPIAANTHCNPNLTPADFVTTAAARTDFCVAFYIDGGDPAKGDDMKATIADTPQGFLATADTSPQCTVEQLMPDRGDPARCPANTQIGTGEALVRVDVGGIIVPQTIKAKVWNIVHSPDEVASVAIELTPELGGVALPHVKIRSRTTLRPNPDVGLRTMLTGQPRTADLGALLGGVHPIAIDGFFLRFWGSKTDHPSMPQSFGMMGSDCSTDQVSKIQAVSWSGDTSNAEDTYRLTDCDKVPFGVSATIDTAEKRPDVPTGATVTVSVDQNFDPKVTGNMKKTVLTLPTGVEFGAQIASGGGGLPLCTAAEFGWDSSVPSTCPADSKVADVSIVSPLQANEFNGAAYVGEQKGPGELPQLFIEGGFGSKPDSPRVKLRGSMRVDENFRVESTLDNLPQVMFKTFKLTFRGGEHAPLVTPRQCGTTNGFIDTTPASTGITTRQDLPLTIDQDCIDPLAFHPSMSVSTSNPQAGARTVTTVSTSRPDREARLSRVEANLPAGILSDLQLATECTVDQAAAFACPDSSRIGTVTAASGVGPAPYTVKGNVYLRTRDEGAVAGVVIAAPVAFGGVNLGTMNVPARIELRPGDLGLKFISDVPQRYKGLSLNLRSFDVALDRPDFAINPTNCSPLSTTSSLTSDTGATALVPISFQVTGCDRLGFDPALGIAITGKTGQGDKPSIGVKVSLAAGGSNIRSTSVTLPPGLGADLNQVSRACPDADWNAGTCSPDAVVGSVKAKIAITPEEIAGKVSMVKIAGQTLPGIGMQLEGRFASRLLGQITIDKTTGQLITSFPSLPDVPIQQLDLTLEGGARGALISTKALCAAPSILLKGSFVGQSGATAQRTATAKCANTLSAGTLVAKVTGTTRSKLTIKFSAPSGKKIRTARMALPSQLSLTKSKVKKTALSGTKSIKVRGKRTLDAVLTKAGKTPVTVTIPKGSLTVRTSGKRKKSFTFVARVAYADGTRETKKLTVKR